MKLHKLTAIILIVFFKTETLFSENELFNVNNIEIEKKDKISNNALANKAIEKGFDQLISKILLEEDRDKFLDVKFSQIKELVTYYQITDIAEKKEKKDLVSFSVTFDKDKMHDLFYKKGILYSEISDKDLYVLPVLIKNKEVYIFNNNFFYEKWNEVYSGDLIEFILPLENIEIIQNINIFKNNLMSINISNLFQEYSDKNLALLLIEHSKKNSEKIFIKARIQGKDISKSLNIEKKNLNTDMFYEKIIIETQKELINLVKSKNLIDIRTPSFLNVKLNISKKSNLVELKSRIKNIDAIENIFVQDFNKDFMNLKIKYLGKLEKMISELRKKNVELKLISDQWFVNTL